MHNMIKHVLSMQARKPGEKNASIQVKWYTEPLNIYSLILVYFLLFLIKYTFLQNYFSSS